MENESTIMNVAEEAIENDVLTEGLDKHKLVKASIIALGVGVVVTGVVMAYKRRGKIKEHFTNKKIEALEKKGYMVMQDPSAEFEEDVEVNPEKE